MMIISKDDENKGKKGLRRKLTRGLFNFLNNKDGSIAIITAFALPVVVVSLGIGIDYIRGATVKQMLDASVRTTLQNLSTEINACLDTSRTNDNSSDYGCFNSKPYDRETGEVFIPNLRNNVQKHVIKQYMSMSGYSESKIASLDPEFVPSLVGDVRINKYSGDFEVGATVSYNCVFMKLVMDDCQINAGSVSVDEKLFAQANPLSLSSNSRLEIWIGEIQDQEGHRGAAASAEQIRNFQVKAEGGWPPYEFGIGNRPGAALPWYMSGLSMNYLAGTLSGMPNGVCTDAPDNGTGASQHACDVSEFVTPFYVLDSGDANRSGRNRQLATTNATVAVVHKLSMSLENQKPVADDKPEAGKPETYYRLIGHRKGGKGPFTYTCEDLPAGSWTCDPNTGVLEGAPGLDSSTLRVCGGVPGCPNTKPFKMIVTDGRGISAEATIPYDWTIQPLRVTAPQWNETIVSNNQFVTGPPFNIISTGKVKLDGHDLCCWIGTLSLNVSISDGFVSNPSWYVSGGISLRPGENVHRGRTQIFVKDTWGQRVTATQEWQFSARAISLVWDNVRFNVTSGTRPSITSTVRATGGVGAMTITGSNVPSWISQAGSSSGTPPSSAYTVTQTFSVSGTPSSVGSGSIRVTARDEAGLTAQVSIPWSVAGAACPLPWGGTIAHGGTVTAYASSSVPYTSSCTSQTRTCNNGSLSGSYQYQSCTRQSAPPPVDPPTPSGPSRPDDNFVMKSFICGPSDPEYNTGVLVAQYKNTLISEYKGFNYGGRCADGARDGGGYTYWQNEWRMMANLYQALNRGASDATALNHVWDYNYQGYTSIKQRLRDAARNNGEHLPSRMTYNDSVCNNNLKRDYPGVSYSARYVSGSGNRCVLY